MFAALLFKPISLAIECLLACIFLIAIVREFTYKLYRGFFRPTRLQNDLLEGKLNFYWSNRAYYFPLQLVRICTVWMLTRFDCYVPIIDCDRQSAKAQYFYDYGWSKGMGTFTYRRINPKAWPILLARRVCGFLFSFFSRPRNQVVKQSEYKPTAQNTASVNPIPIHSQATNDRKGQISCVTPAAIAGVTRKLE